MTATASTRSGSFIPIRPATLGVIATVVGFITWTFSSGSLPAWLPPLWSDTNAMSRDSILLVGPIVAGAGAWVGGWRHTLAIGPTPARGWKAVMTAQLWPLAAAVTAGHLIGLIPAVVNTATNATGGSANPLTIVSGLVAVLAVTCLGYLLGTVWPSRIAPVVAVIAVLPAIVGPILLGEAMTSSENTGTSGASVYGVALNWMDVTIGIGRHETVVGAAARIGLFAVLGAAAVAVAIRSAGRSDLSPRWATGVPLVAPACMAVAILLIQPALVERSTDTPVCEAIPSSQICVGPEIMDVLPKLTAGASSTINQFGYGAATQDIKAGVPLSDLVSFPYYSSSPQQSESEAAITTSRLISGEFACMTRSGTLLGDDSLNSGGELEAAFRFSNELSYAIAVRTTAARSDVEDYLFSFDSHDAAALATMSDAELRAFIDQHSAQLANCEQTSIRP